MDMQTWLAAASFGMSAILLIINLNLKASVAELKAYALEKFVTKEDFKSWTEKR